jgi:hypothetical protein
MSTFCMNSYLISSKYVTMLRFEKDQSAVAAEISIYGRMLMLTLDKLARMCLSLAFFCQEQERV